MKIQMMIVIVINTISALKEISIARSGSWCGTEECHIRAKSNIGL